MTIPENNQPGYIPPIYRTDSGLATASLICGLVGWFIPFLGSLAAVITGHLGRKEIRESQGLLTGDGMALAGLIMGYIQLAFCLLILFAIIALMAVAINDTNTLIGSYSYLLSLL
jgi:hypothetical protein